MTPEELVAAIGKITEGLKADMKSIQADSDAKFAKLNEKASAIADALAKKDAKRRDADDPAGDMNDLARQTAADGIMNTSRATSADRNAFADAQAKADSAMRTLGACAPPPMSGEDLVAYQIRLARHLQPYSKTWKDADLRKIAADSAVFGIALEQIRSDAMSASRDTTGMPEYQHRMVERQLPTGQIAREWVGRGTIFKQLSTPPRYVRRIMTPNDRMAHALRAMGH